MEMEIFPLFKGRIFGVVCDIEALAHFFRIDKYVMNCIRANSIWEESTIVVLSLFFFTCATCTMNIYLLC